MCYQARDGWWEGEYLEYIRQVLRRKFFSLLEHNEQLPESAMDDLTTHMEEYARTNSLGPYRQTGEATSGTGEADGTPGEGAGRAKIKPSSLRHLQKPTAKPKAIPGRDRVSGPLWHVGFHSEADTFRLSEPSAFQFVASFRLGQHLGASICAGCRHHHGRARRAAGDAGASRNAARRGGALRHSLTVESCCQR